jgi:hypothetical protein
MLVRSGGGRGDGMQTKHEREQAFHGAAFTEHPARAMAGPPMSNLDRRVT